MTEWIVVNEHYGKVYITNEKYTTGMLMEEKEIPNLIKALQNHKIRKESEKQ
ncbi:MAG: hypothetical protein ACFFAO_06430 [Candidatus Hermodarchaeota archaeon]